MEDAALKKKFIKRIKRIPYLSSTYVILAHNLYPFAGVIFFGWDPGSIIMLYIAETIIIGIINVPKMLISTKDIKQQDNSYVKVGFASKLFYAIFFIIHYNFFNYGQITLFAEFFSDTSDGVDYFINTFLYDDTMRTALYIISASYLFSFIFDFIIKKEYREYSPLTLMFLPYPRIFIQQFVGLFGAFLILLFSLPFSMLILLQACKTAAELLSNSLMKGTVEFKAGTGPN